MRMDSNLFATVFFFVLQICNTSHPPSVKGQESECAWKFYTILIVLMGHTGLSNLSITDIIVQLLHIHHLLYDDELTV